MNYTVLLQYGIEKKVSDLETLYSRVMKNPTQCHKSFSQSVMLKSRTYIEYIKQGYIIGNNINLDYGNLYQQEIDVENENDEEDEKEEKFDGAFSKTDALKVL